ncbi:MAG: hypothetical protein U0441_11730 [Polyangiaceae bacterium]
MRAYLSFSGILTLALATGCSGTTEPAAGPPAPTGSSVTVAAPSADPSTATETPSANPTATASANDAPPPPPHGTGQMDLTNYPGDPRLSDGVTALLANEAARARQAFSKVVPEIDVNGSLDVRMAAHALLARACQSAQDAKCAAAHYQTVRELWKDPEAAVKSMEALGGSDAEKNKRIARALLAVGEAMYYVAEEKRLVAEAEKMPEYKGPGQKDQVLKHIQSKVAPWVQSRRAKIEDAEKAYVAILNVQPFPSPRWVVDAAARVGQMWGHLAAQFRTTPIPKEWAGTGKIPGTNTDRETLRADYYAALDQAAEPLMARARNAFKTCSDLSVKWQYTDDLSKSCDDWLKKYPLTP